MKTFSASPQWQVEAVSQKLKPKMASIKHKQSKTKRHVAAPKKASHRVCPASFLESLAEPRSAWPARLKLPFFNQQNNTCLFLCPIRLNSTVIDNCLYVMLALRRYIRESPKRNIFPMLEMDSRNYPLPPHANVDDTNVKNQTRRPALNLKDLSLMQGPTLKFQGQGDTHRVTMKSKARLHTQ